MKVFGPGVEKYLNDQFFRSPPRDMMNQARKLHQKTYEQLKSDGTVQKGPEDPDLDAFKQFETRGRELIEKIRHDPEVVRFFLSNQTGAEHNFTLKDPAKAIIQNVQIIEQNQNTQ
mgnify:CR=1 FL=1